MSSGIILTMIILCFMSFMISWMIIYSIKKMNDIIVRIIEHNSEIYKELIECKVIDESTRFNNNPDGGSEHTKKESIGDSDRLAMAFGKQQENITEKVSKGAKTTVPFGEDVSE